MQKQEQERLRYCWSLCATDWHVV